MAKVDVSDLGWLDTKRVGDCYFTRYAIDNEESVWVCDYCEHDQDDDGDEGCSNEACDGGKQYVVNATINKY